MLVKAIIIHVTRPAQGTLVLLGTGVAVSGCLDATQSLWEINKHIALINLSGFCNLP